MFKNIIAPVQAWLLSQGKCVGCGKPLSKASVSVLKPGLKRVACRCGRIFILDDQSGKYRRASLEEAK